MTSDYSRCRANIRGGHAWNSGKAHRRIGIATVERKTSVAAFVESFADPLDDGAGVFLPLIWREAEGTEHDVADPGLDV